MNTTTSPVTAVGPLARLNGSHGYRLEGDTVHLNAMFAQLHADAHNRNWALQLWACPTAPSNAQEISGHKIAEVALPPMGELADESESFSISTFVYPPAGAGTYAMALVLVSGRNGRLDEIQDFSVYPQRQQFNQPRMSGQVNYRIEGSRLHLSVGRVENPRPTGNLSGLLSLELWALPTAYTGGRFEGHHLAGVQIGSLAGQNTWDLAAADLDFRAPPAGSWNLTLMLREWTAQGFVTRDYVNFTARYTVGTSALVTKPAAVVDAPASVAAPKAVAPTAPAAPVVAKAPAPAVPVAQPAPVAPIKAIAPAPATAQPAAPNIAAAKPAAPAVAVVTPKGVSVNSAPVEELAAIEGLNKKLAEGIVKKRPFHSVDDIRRVKGIGGTILDKVRARLRL